MPNSTSKSNDNRDLAYLSITDFTAGIQSPLFNNLEVNPFGTGFDTFATLSQVGTSQAQSPTVPADPSGTYGCFAMSNGALFPFGFSSSLINAPAPHVTPLAASSILVPCATEMGEPGRAYFLLVYKDASSHWVVDLWTCNAQSLDVTFIDSQAVGATSPIPQVFISKTYIQPASLILPAIIWGGYGIETKYYEPHGGSIGVIDTGVQAKRVFTHQTRIISLSDFVGGPVADEFVEGVNFTDPPLSVTMGAQQELFYPENPASYGAWGAVSSSELLLVKSTYGGVVVSGDVFSPYITNVPSIPGTLGLAGQAAIAAGGLCYLSGNNGVWIWNGGAQAQKLSANLSDSSFQNNDVVTETNQNSVCYNYNSFLLVQNGWVYDFTTNAWWRLWNADAGAYSNTNVTTYHAYALNTASVNGFYAFPGAYIAGTTPPILTFGGYTSEGASPWQWQSQPIIVSNGEEVEVREVVVNLIVGELFSTTVPQVTITAYSSDGYPINGSQAQTFDIQTIGLQKFRFECHILSPSIILRVQVGPTGSNDMNAVVMPQVDIGYRERWHTAVV